MKDGGNGNSILLSKLKKHFLTVASQKNKKRGIGA